MIDLVMLQVVRDLVAIFGVIAGLTYYTLAVRNAKKARQTQLYMPIYTRMDDEEFQKKYWDIMNNWDWNDYDDFYEKYGPASNLEAFAKSASVSVFFTMVGILLKRKEIDVNLVDDTMRTFSMRYWEKFEPIITEGRIRFNFPRLEAGQEFLYNEMKKRQQQELKT